MDLNRFTEKLQESIRSAQGMAVRYGQQQIDVEHLLLALLEQEGMADTCCTGPDGGSSRPRGRRLELLAKGDDGSLSGVF